MSCNWASFRLCAERFPHCTIRLCFASIPTLKQLRIPSPCCNDQDIRSTYKSGTYALELLWYPHTWNKTIGILTPNQKAKQKDTIISIPVVPHLDQSLHLPSSSINFPPFFSYRPKSLLNFLISLIYCGRFCATFCLRQAHKAIA